MMVVLVMGVVLGTVAVVVVLVVYMVVAVAVGTTVAAEVVSVVARGDGKRSSVHWTVVSFRAGRDLISKPAQIEQIVYQNLA